VQTKTIPYFSSLPAPGCASSNPLGYKFSQSSFGVLLTIPKSASYISAMQSYFIPPAYAFVTYTNRDSVPFMVSGRRRLAQGTLQYQGFPEFVRVLVEMELLDGG